MPAYTFHCDACPHSFERTLPIGKRDTPQKCPACQSTTHKVLPGEIGTVLRGDAWVGKNARLKEQMASRRARVLRREEAFHHDGPKCRLVPNVGGEEVDSWSEAAKLAASTGKDTTLYKRKAQEKTP